METSAKKSFDTRHMVRISILGLLGYVLLLFNFPLPIFPSFIKIDIANLPGIIASVTMGPMAGAGVELVKNLVKALLSSETIGIGEISNFICGISLVMPIGFIYKMLPNLKGYVLGSAVGVLALAIIASISNYFFIIPMYALAFGGMEAIVGFASKVNANVSDLSTLIVFSIIPFNLLKGTLNVVLGYAIYKFIRPVFAM